MKITIIGAGNMGGAIARGLAQGNIFTEKEITVTARSQKTLDKLKATNPAFNLSNNNAEAVKGADLILLAIKPWLLESVFDQIRSEIDLSKQIILSVVAGVSFNDLVKMIDCGEDLSPILFRVIPNTAISIGQSMTLISSFNTNDEQDALVKSIFDELGDTLFVDEELMGAGTALCSCGIAYAFKYVKAAIDGGIEMGFSAEQAKTMVAQTIKGAAEMLIEHKSMPDTEIYKVTTPGGITIKGLNEMEAQGFTNAVIKGLKASVK